MKKITIGILTGAILLVGAGSIAFAETLDGGPLNFGQMKPFMEKMHPNLSTKELKEMYNFCHGKDSNTFESTKSQ